MNNRERSELLSARPGLLTGAAAAAALMVLGGCSASFGATKTVNTDKAEEVIRTFLEDKVEGPVQEVSCPEREAKKGDVFECTARVDGQPVRLRITQNDNSGNVSIDMAQAILDVKQAVTFLEQEVGKAKGFPVKADCGTQRYLVRDPGTTFDCSMTTAKSGRPSGKVIVTVKDVAGNVDLRLA